MFDERAIREEVEDYLGEFAGDFDVDAIVDDLRGIEPDVSSIDDLDGDEWTEMVQRHDLAAQRS